jgi:hypothetical protein
VKSGASDGSLLPGYPVDRDELKRKGFVPLQLRVLEKCVHHADGVGARWDTLGEPPNAPGIYLFTVTEAGHTHVVYVGSTENLWMVTKGRLPTGTGRNSQARPAQRYGGNLKYLGPTRKRINILAAEQMRRGRTVEHWVKEMKAPPADPRRLRRQLTEEEESFIESWHLRECGWNRG